MALYVLCDTHLSTGLDKPMDIFGSRWDGCVKKLAERWSDAVSPEDTVVVGGDISWAMTLSEARGDLRFLDSLPGRKILLRGNHDYWWNSAKKMREFFADCGFASFEILQNNAFACGNHAVCGTRGWYVERRAAPSGTDYDKIVAREAQRLVLSLATAEKELPGLEPIVFLHFPPVFGDCVCEPIAEVLVERGVKRCFFGHIHGVYDIPSTTVYEGVELTLASADYLDFAPLFVN